LENASRAGGEKSVSQYSYFSKPALSQTKSTLESNLRSFQSLQQSGTGKGYINAAYNQQASQVGGSPSRFPNPNLRSNSQK
jgi:hypothetical protein